MVLRCIRFARARGPQKMEFKVWLLTSRNVSSSVKHEAHWSLESYHVTRLIRELTTVKVKKICELLSTGFKFIVSRRLLIINIWTRVSLLSLVNSLYTLFIRISAQPRISAHLELASILKVEKVNKRPASNKRPSPPAPNQTQISAHRHPTQLSE